MPTAPKRVCTQPGCPNFQPCPDHPKGQRTTRAKEWLALYNCARWRNYRLFFLKRHPLCCDPFVRHGGPEAATVVDHVKPHRGDYALFWDKANHRALCKSCNSYKAARFEGAFGNDPLGEA